jgi:hypothetical protein
MLILLGTTITMRHITTIITIITTTTTKTQSRTSRQLSMGGNRVFPRAAQLSLCTTIIMSKAHRITTIITTHLVLHFLQQSYLPRFTTSNLYLRKPPSFHVSTSDHTYTKPQQTYQYRTHQWMTSLDTHPDPTDSPDLRLIRSTAPLLSECLDST